MSQPLDRITIQGFKSIRSVTDLSLGRFNVLIGANGAGKSNFVSFFSLLRSIVDQRLQLHIRTGGGADKYLHLGPKVTHEIIGQAYFGLNGYEFRLEPTQDNTFVFGNETVYFQGVHFNETRRVLGTGHTESLLPVFKDKKGADTPKIVRYVYNGISSWLVYHFHDTSEFAKSRRAASVRDNGEFRADASNLAPFLLLLRESHPDNYQSIRERIRLVAPFFNDFVLRPQRSSQDQEVLLEWTQKGSNYPFHPAQISDGTLRFVCLATALLQPNPPSTVIIDEPELGLHPFALNIVSEMLHAASERTQVIISTQSPALLDSADPGDVIVADRQDEESIFTRPSKKALSAWLKEYTLGELWEKNVLGGRPA